MSKNKKKNTSVLSCFAQTWISNDLYLLTFIVRYSRDQVSKYVG